MQEYGAHVARAIGRRHHPYKPATQRWVCERCGYRWRADYDRGICPQARCEGKAIKIGES